MNQKIVKTIALGAFALVTVLGEWWQAQAQDPKAPYASMAPLEQYLMSDRNAEIAMAQSAAPAAISNDAEIWVLTRHGYEIAVKGKNGFVCVVERSWMAHSTSRSSGIPRCGVRSASILRPFAQSYHSLSKGQNWFWRACPKLRSSMPSRYSLRKSCQPWSLAG